MKGEVRSLEASSEKGRGETPRERETRVGNCRETREVIPGYPQTIKMRKLYEYPPKEKRQEQEALNNPEELERRKIRKISQGKPKKKSETK